MKKARLIVKEKIIHSHEKRMLTEEELEYLDGIYRSPFSCFDDNATEDFMFDELVKMYGHEYAHLNNNADKELDVQKL